MTPEQMKRSAAVYSCAAAFNKGFDLLVKREPTAARRELRRGCALLFRLFDDPLLREVLPQRWAEIYDEVGGPFDQAVPREIREAVRDGLFFASPFMVKLAIECLVDAARMCEAVKLKDQIGGKL